MGAGGHLHLGTPIPAGRRPGPARPGRRNKPPPPLAGRHLCTTSSPGRSAGRPSKTCGHRLPSAPAGTRLRSPPAPRTAVSTWRGCWALGTAWPAGQSQPLGCGLGILHPHHPSAPERAPRGAWDGNGASGPNKRACSFHPLITLVTQENPSTSQHSCNGCSVCGHALAQAPLHHWSCLLCTPTGVDRSPWGSNPRAGACSPG